MKQKLYIAALALFFWANVAFTILSVIAADSFDLSQLLLVGMLNICIIGINYTLLEGQPKSVIDKVTGMNLCDRVYNKIFKINK